MEDIFVYLENKKIELEKELTNINTILTILKKQPIDFSKFKVVQNANERFGKIPDSYNSKLTYPIQVLWALEKIGPQTVKDMVHTIVLLYETEDNQRLFNGLTYAASMLHKKGILNATRVGKANRYSLKEKSD
jgi:hypothetical protein